MIVRLLRRRQAHGHAEGRTPFPQGVEQSGGEFSRARQKTRADDAGLSVPVWVTAVRLDLLRRPAILSLRPVPIAEPYPSIFIVRVRWRSGNPSQSPAKIRRDRTVASTAS
jgi:hypothetical protein